MALTPQTISLQVIVAQVYRDLGITEEYDTIDLIEWAVDALRFINAFGQYEKVEECIKISNYKAEIPCGLIALLEIDYNGSQLSKASNNNFRRINQRVIEPYSYNLNNLDSLPLKLGRMHYLPNGESFIFKNGWIKTSFCDGIIKIKYNKLAVDDDGIPTIPDEVSYKEAITWFIKMKHFYKKAIKEDRYRWFYQDAEVKWNKYCNQAGTKAMMPDIFTLENIKRNFLSFVPKINSYNNFFDDLNVNNK